MNYYIIAYDIADPKRLNRIHKTLKDYGNPLQFSIFECYLTRKDLIILQDKLERIINNAEDRIIVLALCPPCKDRITIIGKQEMQEQPNGAVVV
ncbi:MAG: CRISPR-associated endonuclease Cas2 [Planctomycetes bacterium]|nr:CRISPR-associated endonuclease Cas2 [Planctomycetota bacterium]